MNEEIIKEFIGEKGETVIIKTLANTDHRQDNRPDSPTFGQTIDVILPTVKEDHGTWYATWDKIAYSQNEASLTLEELKTEHIK